MQLGPVKQGSCWILGQTQRTTASSHRARSSPCPPVQTVPIPNPPWLPASPGNGVWTALLGHHHQHQVLLCIWVCFVVVGYGCSHCSFASPGCPCCWSSSPNHCRMQYCSYGLREGRCCSAALLRCSALSSERNCPKRSHKTQFTIPAAFWHPGVLAYR